MFSFQQSLVTSGSGDILHLVADRMEVLLKGGLADHHRAAAVIRVKTERSSLLETTVQKQDHVVLRVIDQSERTHAARLQTQIPHHPLRRGKRQLTGGILALRHQHLLQPVLDVMNSQIVITGESDEIMLIALVIAHEYVLAMHTAVIMPPSLGLLDGLAFRVVIGRERYPVFLQIPQHLLLPLGYYLIFVHLANSINWLQNYYKLFKYTKFSAKNCLSSLKQSFSHAAAVCVREICFPPFDTAVAVS